MTRLPSSDQDSSPNKHAQGGGKSTEETTCEGDHRPQQQSCPSAVLVTNPSGNWWHDDFGWGVSLTRRIE
jgi:hypothetical protein